jgi:hypothetical protein
VKLVTLTITGNGYLVGNRRRRFAAVVFGLIVRALERRRKAGIAPSPSCPVTTCPTAAAALGARCWRSRAARAGLTRL